MAGSDRRLGYRAVLPGDRVTAPSLPPRIGGPREECTYIGRFPHQRPPQPFTGVAAATTTMLDHVEYDDGRIAHHPVGAVLSVA